MTPIHPFEKAIQLDNIDENIRRGHTQPEWANMVGPFGGITAAILVRAVETHPDRIGEPPALTVNFAAPIADGDFDVSLRAARTNRSNQHWMLEISQHGDATTTATALFGTRRDTWADTEGPPERAGTGAGRSRQGARRLHRLGTAIRHAVRRRTLPRRRCTSQSDRDDDVVDARRRTVSSRLPCTGRHV